MSVLAALSIGGWVIFGAAFLWWQVEPARLPDLSVPIPILNADNTIRVGEPVIMELKIEKGTPREVVGSTRFISCDSGNLVTLTSVSRSLPTGSFTVIADDVLLPDKFLDGDICKFTYRIEYRINWVRTEVAEWSSEPFLVDVAGGQRRFQGGRGSEAAEPNGPGSV